MKKALAFGVGLMGVGAVCGNAQSERASTEGAKLYETYCIDCHGKEGKTPAPAATRPKSNVPDLQFLARRNKGVFPLERVEKLLSGTKQAPVIHGGIEMPTWGSVVLDRVHALARYIESIQK